MSGRKTMNISLPQQMKTWLDREVAVGQFGSASEYIRHLLRQAQAAASRGSIDAKLREAIEEGPPTPMTSGDWRDIRQDGKRRAARLIRDRAARASKRRRSA